MNYRSTLEFGKVPGMMRRVARIMIEGYPVTLIRTKNTRKKRIVAAMMNMILVTAFIPVFVLGVYLYSTEVPPRLDWTILKLLEDFANNHVIITIAVSIIIPFIIGVVVHELGHANATRACKKGRVYEYGVIIGLIPAFYTAADDTMITGPYARLKKLQIMCSGVEANLFFAGIFMVLASLCRETSYFFMNCADMQLMFVAINVLFVKGFDGDKVIRIILGMDGKQNETIEIKKMIRSKRYRGILLSQGMVGHMKLITCYVVVFFQLLYPVLVMLNIILLGGMFLW